MGPATAMKAINSTYLFNSLVPRERRLDTTQVRCKNIHISALQLRQVQEEYPSLQNQTVEGMQRVVRILRSRVDRAVAVATSEKPEYIQPPAISSQPTRLTSIDLPFQSFNVAGEFFKLTIENDKPWNWYRMMRPKVGTNSACLLATLDAFYDLRLRSFMNDKAFFTLRKVYPELQLWTFDQNFLDTNTSISEPSHILQTCLMPF